MSTDALNNDLFAMSGILVFLHLMLLATFYPPHLLLTCTASKLSRFVISSAFSYSSPLARLQIACFIICAIAQGTAFARWRKWSAEEKSRGWWLYGWFTALSCLGSTAGALAYVARMGHLYGVYETREIANQTLTPQQAIQQATSSRDMMRCAAAYHVLFPLELGFVTTANLFVLHRMHRFSTLRSLHQRAWLLSGRLFLAAAIICNSIGFVSNIVSAAYFSQSGDLYAAGESFPARDRRQEAARAAAYQRFSEVVLLAMIIIAFCIVGVNSYQVILSALRALVTAKDRMRTQSVYTVSVPGAVNNVGRELIDEASTQGITLKRKVLCTFAFTFSAVLVRTLFTVMFALGAAGNNNSDKCSRSECSACKNVYSHIQFWIVYTPVFQQTVLLIASPLGSLVALWGMSGVRALEQVSDQLVQLDNIKSLKQPTSGGSVL
jgi:hypothetical protein